MEIVLKQMHAGQVSDVAQLWNAGWQDGHAGLVPDELARLRTYDSFASRMVDLVPQTQVAMQGETLLGFVTVLKDEVYQMYVAPAGRGTGVAGKLMDKAEAQIAQAGHNVAWLSCAIGNERAAAFYRKCGWAHTQDEDALLTTSTGPFTLRVWRFEKAVTP